jgi:hypothetical protein
LYVEFLVTLPLISFRDLDETLYDRTGDTCKRIECGVVVKIAVVVNGVEVFSVHSLTSVVVAENLSKNSSLFE